MKTEISSNQQNSKKQKYANMGIILVILILVSLISYTRGEGAVALDWTESQLQVTLPDREQFTVRYADVTEAELIPHPNYGACVRGGQTASWLYGIWENDTWGNYSLCAATGVELCIVLHTDPQVYVLSYESSETTSALFESILTLIPQ